MNSSQQNAALPKKSRQPPSIIDSQTSTANSSLIAPEDLRLTLGPGIPANMAVHPEEWIKPLLQLFSDATFQHYHDERYLVNALYELLSPEHFVMALNELRARCPLSGERLDDAVKEFSQARLPTWSDPIRPSERETTLWQCDLHMMACRADRQGFIQHVINRVRVFLETHWSNNPTATEALYLQLLQYLSFPYLRVDGYDPATWYVFAPYPMTLEQPSVLNRNPNQYARNDEIRSWLTVTDPVDIAYHLYAPVVQILREVARSYKTDHLTASIHRKELLMTYHMRADTLARACESRITHGPSIAEYRPFCRAITYCAAYPRCLMAFSNGVYDLMQQHYRGYLPSDGVMQPLYYAFRTIRQLSPDFTPNPPHPTTLGTLLAFYSQLWPEAAQRAIMLRRLSSFVLAPFRTKRRCCAVLGGRYLRVHQALLTLIRYALDHYVEQLPMTLLESPLINDCMEGVGPTSRYIFTNVLSNPVIWEHLLHATNSKAVLISVYQKTTTPIDICCEEKRFCYYNRSSITPEDSNQIWFRLIDAPQDITHLPDNDTLYMVAPYFMCSMIDIQQILDMM